MSTKKPKPPTRPVAHWQKAARSIPFIDEFSLGGERRDADMELQRLTALKAPTPAEAALRIELERYRADPPRAAAVDQQKLLAEAAKDFEAAEQRALRRGGKTGRKNTATDRVRDHIRELRAKYPKLSPPQIFKKADPRIYGKMAEKTFCNHVRALRAK
jgi:hypothetical protein